MTGASDRSSWPLLWLAVTLLAYHGAQWIHRRSGTSPLANPVAISVAAVAAVLFATGTPYRTYADAAQPLSLLVGPATVALAIPLHGQLGRLRSMAAPLGAALLVGSIAAIASAAGIGWAFGASAETVWSLAPKSATMPVAMAVAERIGGPPSVTALAVAITGVSGAVMARGLFRLIGVGDPAVRGFALGVTAHAIGAAAALQMGEAAGAFAALGMGLNAVATVLLVPLVQVLVALR
jgi:putative effector of murein hydrolase